VTSRVRVVMQSGREDGPLLRDGRDALFGGTSVSVCQQEKYVTESGDGGIKSRLYPAGSDGNLHSGEDVSCSDTQTRDRKD